LVTGSGADDVIKIIFFSLRPFHTKSKKKSQNKTLLNSLYVDPNRFNSTRPCVACTRLPAAPPRTRGADAMWSTLFTVTFLVAVALSFAAIVMDYAGGGLD
jgi:hypothetical protein